MFRDEFRRFFESDIRRASEELNDLFGAFKDATRPMYPPVDAYSDDDGIVVVAELPGIDASDLDISVLADTLSIRGSRKVVELDKGSHYFRRERPIGEFHRNIKLPFRVEPGRVDASFKEGLLKIVLPREGAERPVKVDIQG